MKVLVCVIAVVSFLGIRAQAQDKITLISGESLKVKVVKIGEEKIEYSFPGETVINEVLKTRVNQIVFESGRTEVINEIVKIEGESDWEKVKTITKKEAEGLKRIGSYEEKVTGPYMRYDNALAKAKVLAAQKAASLKCPYVVIVSESIAGFSPVTGAKIKYEVYE